MFRALRSRLRAGRTPDDEHLLVLLRGETAAGEGSYSGAGRWTTRLLSGRAGSPAARLVTVHEAMHASLNDVTAFGMALAALGAVRNEKALPRLVAQTRTVHEAFATFASLWAAADGDLTLLGDRPVYRSWYRDAADLVPLPDGAPRCLTAVDEAARACLQSDALDALLEQGLGEPSPRVRPTDRPDVRFRMLHQHADQQFWERTWAGCREVLDQDRWALVMKADTDTGARADWAAPENTEARRLLAVTLYDSFADLLCRAGAPTLGYDDHQDRSDATIDAVETLAPDARGLLRAASRGGEQPREEVVEVWSRERLVVRKPRTAALWRLQDQPPVTLLHEGEQGSHLYLLVRPAFRLLEQFHLPDDEAAALAARGAAPVAALVGNPLDPVDLVLVDTPGLLETVVDTAADVPVYASIALSALGDTTWTAAWEPALSRCVTTALIDLSPTAQFRAWRNDGSALRYTVGTLSGGDVAASLFVAELDGGGLRLILPCTDVVADMLDHQLTESYPEAARTDEVLTEVENTVRTVLTHLVTHEHSFDVDAYHRPAKETP